MEYAQKAIKDSKLVENQCCEVTVLQFKQINKLKKKKKEQGRFGKGKAYSHIGASSNTERKKTCSVGPEGRPKTSVEVMESGISRKSD